MHDLNALRAFIAVVESGSFSQAAIALACANSSISRQVAQLEQQLGQRLLVRSTRVVRTTDAGAELFERVQGLLPQIDAACSSLPNEAGQPAGRLRVSVPWWFSECHIAPALSRFHQQFPSIQLELIANDSLVDVLAQGFDVVIRLSALKDSELVAKPLGAHRFVLAASPDYLSRFPEIKEPEDLKSHHLMAYAFSTRSSMWFLKKQKKQFRISAEQSWLQSNNASMLYQCALDGGGIIMQPTWAMNDALSSGALLKVLADYEVTPSHFDSGVYAVYSKHQRNSPKIKAFIEFLIANWDIPQ